MSPFAVNEEKRVKIRGLLAPLPKSARRCWDIEALAPTEFEDMKKSGFTRPDPEGSYDFCTSHGLPISRVLSAYRLMYAD